MKNSLIRVMAIAILATSMSGFAQAKSTKQDGGKQTASEKKSKKKSDKKKTNDQMKDNDSLFQIYG